MGRPVLELAQTLVGLGLSRLATHPLSRAVALNPGLANGWRLLGDIAMVSGQVAAAREAYDRLLMAVIPDPRLRPAAGALAEGRLDTAERDLRTVLSRDPTSLPAAHLLSEVLMRQGRPAAAEELLIQVLQRAPGLHMARQSYASALFAGGKHLQALADLDRIPYRQSGQSARPDDEGRGPDRDRRLRRRHAEVTASVLDAFPDQPQGWLVQGGALRFSSAGSTRRSPPGADAFSARPRISARPGGAWPTSRTIASLRRIARRWRTC